MTEEEKATLIVEVKTAIKTYHRIANALRFTLVFLGIIGIASALFVTAFTGSKYVESDDCIRIASFISALCLTSLSAFNVTAKGNNARNAYRYLNNGYFMYHIGKFTEEDLVNAKDTAEKIHGSVDFQTSVQQKPSGT